MKRMPRLLEIHWSGRIDDNRAKNPFWVAITEFGTYVVSPNCDGDGYKIGATREFPEKSRAHPTAEAAKEACIVHYESIVKSLFEDGEFEPTENP